MGYAWQDLLPPESCAELGKLQDRMQPFPQAQAESLVTAQLGASPHTLFQRWPAAPAAAASIGQVYKAVLPGGREVAVKVQRPGLHERLELDALVLRRVAGQLQRFVQVGQARSSQHRHHRNR